jgi:NADH pyrophosphatase NudC (nudix superfamily)
MALDRPAGRMLRALHIIQWRGEARFCGSCGAENIDAPDELARLCPACGRMEFPRIAPAVITLIVNGADQALLAHNKKFAPGVYSLIAGFTEAGESLESTVVREVREEVNIEVRDIRYIASQPWPFPNSLMLGFTARYASGELRPDGQEIEDAQWFSRDKLPLLPGHGSVSRYLINRWIAGKIRNPAIQEEGGLFPCPCPRTAGGGMDTARPPFGRTALRPTPQVGNYNFSDMRNVPAALPSIPGTAPLPACLTWG